MLSLTDFSKIVFGKEAEDFDGILMHPDQNDAFWQTRYGGYEAHDAVKNANIPILFITVFYDRYTGGIFHMWNTMEESTKSKSALVVTPYDHGSYMAYDNTQTISFRNGNLEGYQSNFAVKWFNAARGGHKPPFAPGNITYYRLFDEKWATETTWKADNKMTIPLGKGEITYLYNPYHSTAFKGGLSNHFGGSDYQDEPGKRYDIKTFYSEEFEKDIFVKGKMKARVLVKSDCEDTCFYVRLSIAKKEGDYGLRDDITKISNFDQSYQPNTEIALDFTFDEIAFQVKK